MEELFPQTASQPGQTRQAAAAAASAVTADLNAQLTGVATRLKLMEERYGNLQKRNQLTEETLLSFEREMSTELRVTLQQVVELRRKIADIDQKVSAIQGEFAGFVRKHEFAVVERYLDLWQPVRFVTRDEARRIVQDIVKQGPAARVPEGS
jgi:hypothetical protein